MTDTEIIKALECCRDCNCKECPACRIIDGGTHCTEIDEEEILDLINRQKAEIERLQKIIVGFMDEVGTWSNKYDVDISNILKLPLLAKEDWNIRNKIKAEAVKEFAERLKKKAHSYFLANLIWIVEIDDINNLVKEMESGAE